MSKLALLGGEPLIQGMQLVELLEEIRKKFPNKTIWLWTGYEIDGKLDETQKIIISLCDYVVDGQFKKDLSGKKLRFRGSSNQTIWRNENGVFVEATDIEENKRFN